MVTEYHYESIYLLPTPSKDAPTIVGQTIELLESIESLESTESVGATKE